MAEEKQRHQNGTLLGRTRKNGFLLLGFILLMLWFGINLVIAESPEEWKESDITIADIQFISGRGSRWQITDSQGNTYAISRSNGMVEQIIPGSTYHIVYSTNFHNGIRSMTQADLVIVDYEQSISVYSERGIWVWILFFVGVMGSFATIGRMIMDIRKEISVARHGKALKGPAGAVFQVI